MAYQWGGWVDATIEVRYTAGVERWKQWVVAVGGVPGCELLPSATAGPPMDALLPEHQQENSSFVRISGPPLMVMLGMQQLLEVCRQHLSSPHFHEPPAGETR